MPYIQLTRGQFALIDAVDIPLVGQFKWYAQTTRTGFMAARNDYSSGTRKLVYMHTMIAGTAECPCVDHRNHKQLDNRRCNLRACTYGQNAFNRRKPYRKNPTSRFKGVCFSKGKWLAQIGYQYKMIRLGVFETELDAARAYDREATKHYGDFALVNFRRTA